MKIVGTFTDVRALKAGKVRAYDRLQGARRELADARADFEEWEHDLSFERVRQAEVGFEDSVAVAQEWAVPNTPGLAT